MQAIQTMLENVSSKLTYSEDCERGVLGCCLLEPELLDEVATEIAPEDFYDLRHANTLKLMQKMRAERLPVDILALREESKSLDGGIQALGGLPYLTQHQDLVPSGAQLPYYASVVKRKSQRREMVTVARKILAEERGDDDEVLGDYSEMLNKLLRTDTSRGEVAISNAVKQAIDEIEAAFEGGGRVSGLSTGLPSVDHVTGGLHSGDVFVLAGRPSMGKTSLAMSVVEHVALTLNKPVGVASMEMPATALTKRMISSQADVDGLTLLNGRLSQGDFNQMAPVAAKINRAPIYIDETAHLTPSQLLARARIWKLRYDIQLLVVDYLQLMRVRGADNRQHEVSQCSAAMKQIAKELKIPVIALSQLNREVEKGGDGRAPRLSDLKESGSIEQDADLVGLLYRPDGAEDGTVRLNIAKHRNGPTGYCDLEFIASRTRFREQLPDLSDGGKPYKD